METIDPENPPKLCDYFDMIRGTSTSGWVVAKIKLIMSVKA
jgi:patatin-like phospholipase/acyl hydrolase